MITRYAIRPGNAEKFDRCIELRKQGLSYSEIRREVLMAKSTLHNWLTLAGLTLTKEHLETQLKKRIENRPSANIGLLAARFIREEMYREKVRAFIDSHLGNLDPLLIAGCMLYEAEGTKEDCRFSNSDYRIICCFLRFIEAYFDRDRFEGMSFRLYIHVNRKDDLGGMLDYWSEKMGISRQMIQVGWKRHLATLRSNKDYVGQMNVTVRKGTLIGKQIRALSDIILAS